MGLQSELVKYGIQLVTFTSQQDEMVNVRESNGLAVLLMGALQSRAAG